MREHVSATFLGVAQLGERLLWEQEVRGSSPLTETKFLIYML